MPAETSPPAPAQLPVPNGDVLRRRATLVPAVVVLVLAGLLLSREWRGPLSGAVGDALYAVMVYLLVAFVLPRARPAVVGGIALGLCVLIELTQLTGLSAALVQAWRPARYLLGTTFQAVDLVAYAVGAGAGVALDRALLPAGASARLRGRAR